MWFPPKAGLGVARRKDRKKRKGNLTSTKYTKITEQPPSSAPTDNPPSPLPRELKICPSHRAFFSPMPRHISCHLGAKCTHKGSAADIGSIGPPDLPVGASFSPSASPSSASRPLAPKRVPLLSPSWAFSTPARHVCKPQARAFAGVAGCAWHPWTLTNPVAAATFFWAGADRTRNGAVKRFSYFLIFFGRCFVDAGRTPGLRSSVRTPRVFSIRGGLAEGD